MRRYKGTHALALIVAARLFTACGDGAHEVLVSDAAVSGVHEDARASKPSDDDAEEAAGDDGDGADKADADAIGTDEMHGAVEGSRDDGGGGSSTSAPSGDAEPRPADGGPPAELDACTGLACGWGTSCYAGACVVPTCPGTLGFPAPPPPRAGTSPAFAAAADLNRDGWLDLTVANRDGSDVSVLIGRGRGLFEAPANYRTGTRPESIIILDLNADGSSDLAIANQGSGDVSVLLNRGNGSFSASVNYAVGLDLRSLSARDFDRDGAPDLLALTGEGENDYISVLTNRGDGTFAAALHYPAGSFLTSLAVADLNGDGCPDLAVAKSIRDGGVGVFMSRCDGSVSPPVAYGSGASAQFVGAADLNADGAADLAFLSDGNTFIAAPARVEVLLNQGQGRFAAPIEYEVPSLARSIAIDDFDQNGAPDLAVAHAESTRIAVLLNRGDGSFEAVARRGGSPRRYSLLTALSVVAGDFDGDSAPDLVVTDTSDVTVLLNTLGGSFTIPEEHWVGWSSSQSTFAYDIAAGDLNGDGAPDLAAVGGEIDLGVLMNTGDGGYQPAVRYEVGSIPRALAIADFDGDHKLDIASVNDWASNVSVLINRGDGTLRAAVSYPAGEGAGAITASDLNADGRVDLIVGRLRGDDIAVLLNQGQTMAAPVRYTVGAGPHAVGAGDLNGDRAPDVVVANRDSDLLDVLINRGAGTLAAPVRLPAPGSPTALVVADLDADGMSDIALANGGSNDLSVLLNDGAGGFRSAVHYPAGVHPISVAVGDLDGDGRVDLIVGNYNADISVFLNAGAGRFSPAGAYARTFEYTSVDTADVDGDGRLDIVGVNGRSEQIRVLRNRCVD